jgi:hypothetical protein
MGDNSSSVELGAAAVELSEGILRIIGAYGIAAGGDVRVIQPKAATPPRERVLVSADARLASNVPAATG